MKKVESKFIKTLWDILPRLGETTPLGGFSDSFPVLFFYSVGTYVQLYPFGFRAINAFFLSLTYMHLCSVSGFPPLLGVRLQLNLALGG
jgi:hypothetical protein